MSSFAKKKKGVMAPGGASTTISLTSLYISVVLVLAKGSGVGKGDEMGDMRGCDKSPASVSPGAEAVCYG